MSEGAKTGHFAQARRTRVSRPGVKTGPFGIDASSQAADAQRFLETGDARPQIDGSPVPDGYAV